MSFGSTLLYAWLESSRSVDLPVASGRFGVGRTLLDRIDYSRFDPYSPGKSAPRELTVVIWYPADVHPGDARATYLPPGWTALNQGAPFHTPPANLHPTSVENASVAFDAGQLAVLVFAPGLGLGAVDYSALAEDPASRGWLVAGINPTYSTDVVLSGGRVVHSIAAARDKAVYSELVRLWSQDMLFVGLGQ